MNLERKEEIEKYIEEDWYWNDESHVFAFELAKYLFEFMDDLEANSGLALNTILKHYSNCWYIGKLIATYGCHKTFSPEVFAHPPHHEIEFKRIFSDSKYQIQSYNSTCNKVEKYALKRGDLSYEKKK